MLRFCELSGCSQNSIPCRVQGPPDNGKLAENPVRFKSRRKVTSSRVSLKTRCVCRSFSSILYSIVVGWCCYFSFSDQLSDESNSQDITKVNMNRHLCDRTMSQHMSSVGRKAHSSTLTQSHVSSALLYFFGFAKIFSFLPGNFASALYCTGPHSTSRFQITSATCALAEHITLASHSRQNLFMHSKIVMALPQTLLFTWLRT